MKITGFDLDNETILLLVERKVLQSSGIPSVHDTGMYLLSLSREKLHPIHPREFLLFVESQSLKKKL
jgi:hypothetical protein